MARIGIQIGKVSQQTGLGIDAIRFYEKQRHLGRMGLLPDWASTEQLLEPAVRGKPSFGSRGIDAAIAVAKPRLPRSGSGRLWVPSEQGRVRVWVGFLPTIYKEERR